MKIFFVIPRENRGWMYPIIKWKKKLYNNGLDVHLVESVSSIKQCDHIVLCSRHYQKKYGSFGQFMDNFESVKTEITKLKDALHCKIHYYDLSASPGARELSLLPVVDSYLKRQIYSDINIYLGGHKWSSRFRPWDANTEGWIKDFASKGDLSKIKLAWNLGFSDYVTNNKWLKKLNYLNTDDPKFWNRSKLVTMSYRGKATSSQRKILSDYIKNKEDSDKFITGGVLNRKKFLDELSRTKYTVSPFGLGEICYRDFEAVLAGSVLLKPNMNHISTWPDFYRPGENYKALKWDLSDLENVIEFLESNREVAESLRQNSQVFFMQNYMNGQFFVDHIKTLFE